MPEASVPDIVERSTREFTADWNRVRDYSFVERSLESKNEVQPSVKTYQVFQVDGSPYNRLMAVGDRPLSAGEQAAEEQKLRNEIQKRKRESEHERASRVEKYLKEQRQNQALLNGMMEALNFPLVGGETMDGRDCSVLDAKSKPGYQPANHEMKALAGMRGRLWIDRASGHWIKVQAEVFQTVSLYGLFAKVRPGAVPARAGAGRRQLVAAETLQYTCERLSVRD